MKQKRRFPRLVLFGAIIIASAVLGSDFGLPSPLVIAILVIGGLMLATMALWKYANENATGEEWWQDNSSSGWRGY